MTTNEYTHHGGGWMAHGYVPVAETRDRIRDFIAADIDLRSLAKDLGVSVEALRTIARGRTRYVSIRLAEAIASVDLEDAADRHLNVRPYLDEITLDQLAEGALKSNISSIDKPLYARALHTRGWTKTRIARELHMSGATINKVLARQAAA